MKRKIKRYSANDMICREGQAFSGFILLSGKLRVGEYIKECVLQKPPKLRIAVRLSHPKVGAEFSNGFETQTRVKNMAYIA